MDKPRLRPVQAVPIEYKGRPCVQIFDPTRLSDKPMVMSREALYILPMFDGTSTVRDIQAELIRRTGQLVLSDDIRGIIEQLDEALLLDSERFRVHVRELAAAYRRAPARRATGAGSAYPADPAALKAQLDGYFAAEFPDGLEPGANASGRLVGIVSPHIDFDRGGPSYAHAYAPLAREAAEADLFVVLGTAHFAEGSLFIPTAKSYETPFGTLATNEELVHELARRGGGDALFAEELVHASEHSIEFQAVLLKHIFGDRPVEMLPILCGALETHVPDGQSPREVAEVSDFLDALAEVVRASGRTVCTIAGADLSHVGRFFGDDFRGRAHGGRRAGRPREPRLRRAARRRRPLRADPGRRQRTPRLRRPAPLRAPRHDGGQPVRAA